MTNLKCGWLLVRKNNNGEDRMHPNETTCTHMTPDAPGCTPSPQLLTAAEFGTFPIHTRSESEPIPNRFRSRPEQIRTTPEEIRRASDQIRRTSEQLPMPVDPIIPVFKKYFQRMSGFEPGWTLIGYGTRRKPHFPRTRENHRNTRAIRMAINFRPHG